MDPIKVKSLYLHFPFCEAKCHYCDFYSLGRERTRPNDPEIFEKALRLEILRNQSKIATELDTIFMGGGTPSMTPPESMKRSLEPLWEVTRITPQTEWTMEANPSSIELKNFREFRKLGITRISMGVQSLDPEHLKLLGRVHSRDDALRALTQVFEAGFENVSVDLLCGVPGQSLHDLEKNMETLTSFPINHLSCYLLTLAPHHRMASQLPDEDTQLSHLLFIHEWMTARGFEHYEISNFAKPGKQARHNLHYWKGASYLGIGPSAHSYDAGTSTRWKNVSSLHKYGRLLESGESVQEWEEKLTEAQKDLERWLLAVRLSEGFPQDWLALPIQKQRAKNLMEQSLLEFHPTQPDRLRLTPKGFALSDHVIRQLA